MMGTDQELDRETRSAIKHRAKLTAEGLLDAYWDEDSYPVDPFAISTELGAVVFEANLGDDVSGMCRRVEGQPPEIYVAEGENERRQRFTVAHELGHLMEFQNSSAAFVDRKRDAISRTGTDPNELFANEFAANLLMPAVAVRSLRRRGMSTVELAQFFDVSPIAMEHRLNNLRLS